MPEAFHRFLTTLEDRGNVETLDMPTLAAMAAPFARTTSHGGLAFFSNVRNRSAGQSVVLGSDEVGDKNLTPFQTSAVERLDATLSSLESYLEIAPLICVKRRIADNDVFNPKCTLYLSVQRRDNIRQAYLWANTLNDQTPNLPGPDLKLVCVPEWPEHDRQVLVFPEDGLAVLLGIDYVGEVKMGFLRMAMWQAKQHGMLSLHAGAKLLSARGEDGDLRRYGALFFGLSGTGKTTHSCHDHGLHGQGEGIEILQDDIVFLKEDGSALGTEQGFYLKTEGVSPDNQPLIRAGLDSADALLENVMLDSDGGIDVHNLVLGSNGRAVIPRTSFAPHIAESIDMPPLDELDGMLIFFVTRRMTVLPIVSRLSAQQAAATFMLGESIETSAGDPRRAGESVRVVGTNPFLIGSKVDEGNWFYDFLLRHGDKVQCYLVNTGGVGEIRERDAEGKTSVTQPTLRVAIEEMAGIVRGIARGSSQWVEEPNFGTSVPATVEGVDIGKFALEHFYTSDQSSSYASALKLERREWLRGFSGLRPEIVEAM